MDVSRDRDGSPYPVGFIGDLSDPWVIGIADALAVNRPVHRTACAGPLPDRPFGENSLLPAIVIHRHSLGPADADRLQQWRSRGDEPAPALILCISPYVRYEALERWSGLAEMVVSEAIAADVLPGRLARRLDGSGRRPRPADRPACRIEVAGGDGELSRVLVAACERAGYSTQLIDDREIGGEPAAKARDRKPPTVERVLTLWEVPVLEPGWARRLESRVLRTGPVIAVAGFADRAVVTRARQSGAAACLELPCDLDDLIDVVDRVARETPADSWPIPARVEPAHPWPAARRNPRRHRTLATPARWSDAGGPPTIPAWRETE